MTGASHHDVPVEKLFDQFVTSGVAELGATMPGTLDYVERRFQAGFLIPLVDVLALAERHVPVLVAVKDDAEVDRPL